MSSRFPAKPQEIDGYRFASKREAQRYAELRLLEKAGEISGLCLQPKFKIKISAKPYCTYTADFSYWLITRDGDARQVVEEVKSSGTAKDAAYRLRRKAAELYHAMVVTELVR